MELKRAHYDHSKMEWSKNEMAEYEKSNPNIVSCSLTECPLYCCLIFLLQTEAKSLHPDRFLLCPVAVNISLQSSLCVIK